MKDKKRFSPPAIGGISLLVVFAVLCLTIFALLSLSTVRADMRLADATVESVADYYAADLEAQTILTRLRAGERPDGVTVEGNIYSLIWTRPQKLWSGAADNFASLMKHWVFP